MLTQNTEQLLTCNWRAQLERHYITDAQRVLKDLDITQFADADVKGAVYAVTHHLLPAKHQYQQRRFIEPLCTELHTHRDEPTELLFAAFRTALATRIPLSAILQSAAHHTTYNHHPSSNLYTAQIPLPNRAPARLDFSPNLYNLPQQGELFTQGHMVLVGTRHGVDVRTIDDLDALVQSESPAVQGALNYAGQGLVTLAAKAYRGHQAQHSA